MQKLWNLKAEGVTCSADAFYYKGNSWSKISDYDDYFDLQIVVRETAKQGGKTVIEQENEAWIEMAIKRKRSEFGEYAAIKRICISKFKLQAEKAS